MINYTYNSILLSNVFVNQKKKKSSFKIKIYKKLHKKQTNEDFEFFIGLVERSTIVLRFCILFVVLQHNENYVVDKMKGAHYGISRYYQI